MFKKKVYVVSIRTTYNNSACDVCEICGDERIETIVTTKRKAIKYIENFIRGFIDSSKSKPYWFRNNCITKIPSRDFIKNNSVTLYLNSSEQKEILYYEYDLV